MGVDPLQRTGDSLHRLHALRRFGFFFLVTKVFLYDFDPAEWVSFHSLRRSRRSDVSTPQSARLVADAIKVDDA